MVIVVVALVLVVGVVAVVVPVVAVVVVAACVVVPNVVVVAAVVVAVVAIAVVVEVFASASTHHQSPVLSILRTINRAGGWGRLPEAQGRISGGFSLVSR